MSSTKTQYIASPIFSTCEKITFDRFIRDYKTLFDKATFVVWQHHGVFIGNLLDDTELSKLYEWTDESNIVRIRAFDEDKEVHLWRTSNGVIGRIRTDNKGQEEIEYVETSMKLRSEIDKNKFLTTRNYIGYNSIGQAGYVDSRFVEFI